jgi:hypothetical protein
MTSPEHVYNYPSVRVRMYRRKRAGNARVGRAGEAGTIGNRQWLGIKHDRGTNVFPPVVPYSQLYQERLELGARSTETIFVTFFGCLGVCIQIDMCCYIY